jgi:hypothetical protein
MKYILFAAAAIVFVSSCKSKNEGITRSEMNAKIDSLVGIRVMEINQQAMEDLDRRKAIEVKVKADSIVAATLGQTPPVAPAQ